MSNLFGKINMSNKTIAHKIYKLTNFNFIKHFVEILQYYNEFVLIFYCRVKNFSYLYFS